jgi:hypothetical protein
MREIPFRHTGVASAVHAVDHHSSEETFGFACIAENLA